MTLRWVNRRWVNRRWLRIGVSVLFLCSTAFAQTTGGGQAGGPEYNGSVVDCDIPRALRIRNTGGSDGAGLCVWASLEMAASYQNCKELIGTFEWMKSQPGGGWPERVDRVMKERAPAVKYKQYMGKELEFIREGINSGRPVCVTMGTGELYGMQTISHMVICIAIDDVNAAIIDNNDPDNIWWMPVEVFHERAMHPNAQLWAFYTLAPPPPPIPHP